MSASDSVLDLPLESLGLSTRAYTALLLDGLHGPDKITSVGDLIARSARDLLRIPNFGQVSLTDVRSVLKLHGIALKGEDVVAGWRLRTLEDRLDAIEVSLERIDEALRRLAEGPGRGQARRQEARREPHQVRAHRARPQRGPQGAEGPAEGEMTDA